jgi:transposase
LLRAAVAQGEQRVWGVEGTGSYGAGLTAALTVAGERVVEVKRPGRPKHRPSGKSDPIDAVRAAREILARAHQIEPRQRGN